ncbi:MAG: DUF4177 domain-containing protein [Chloroflexi bacterium]|nr:DUF4177 domain-containing protein [Chloroflexota bacterium]MCC6894339.1 hypothetical protein [Anaerolineae bacterium]
MAQRQKWEYLSVFVDAVSEPVIDYLEDLKSWKNGVPRNTPESMIPRLDSYGQDGWELVHMQPVVVGRNADVLAQYTGSGTQGWTSQYFCVFKRPADE